MICSLQGHIQELPHGISTSCAFQLPRILPIAANLPESFGDPPAPAPFPEKSRDWEILPLPQIPAILPAGSKHAQSTG